MNHKEDLKQLQIALANRRISLLVGAGFSKNVDRSFPDWIQLLMDLVYKLYEDEISLLIPPTASDDEKYDIKKNQVEKILSKKGYLKVVSEYTDRKGFEESIVVYIEENTPIIQDIDEKYYLIAKDGTRKPLDQESLKLHRFLLSLPWNNVYTTNYDPLLEASVDSTLHAKITEENIELEKKLASINTEIGRLSDETQSLQNELLNIENELKAATDPDPLSQENIDLAEKEKKRIDLTKQIGQLRLRQNNLNADKTDMQRKYNRNQSRLNDCYTVVTSGRDLRVKRNKNIIKLHGSLRTQKERDDNIFGFDGDPRKQYIISTEHYDDYPTKHEAFAQLMRISLLQESFCLIGFSGVDPNFLGWIRWVRDLLYQGAEEKKGKGYKIYLIDVRPEPTPNDRLLFFENHSIVRIPLSSPEIIQFLENETNLKINTGDPYGSALQMLFQFLASNEYIISPVIPRDTSPFITWRKAWEKLINYEKGINININEIDSTIEILKPLLSSVSPADLTGFDSFSQFRFLSTLNQLGGKLEGVEQSKIDFLIKACASTLLAPTFMLWNFDIGFELRRELAGILQRDEAIKDPLSTTHYDTEYINMLRLAFSYRYAELKNALDSWNPPIDKSHLKAGFLALFDSPGAATMLKIQISSDAINEQQRMYSYELLYFIERAFSFGDKEERLKEQIKQFEKSGYISIVKRLKLLADSVKNSPTKLKPYGKGRFSVSNFMRIGVFTDAKEPIEYLMLLLHYAFPSALGYRQLIDSEEYYGVFKRGFQAAPFPFIYYALQYTSQDIAVRIGQDVANSEYLQPQKPSLLNALLDAYSNIPANRQDALITIASEIFLAVGPSNWEEKFHSIWKEMFTNKSLFSLRPNATDNFTKNGLRFVENRQIIYEIIIALLEHLKEESSKVISQLYYLNKNYLFFNNNQSDIPVVLTDKIDTLIQDLQHNVEDNIFALGNLNKLLSPGQLEQIHQELTIANFTGIKSERTFRIILFFTKRDQVIHAQLIKAIINHPSLWNTGITDNTITMGAPMLDLLSLTDKSNSGIGVHLKTDELHAIFDKLKSAFADILRIAQKPGNDFNFTAMAEPFYLFLDAYKEALIQLPEFNSTFEKVKQIYEKDKGYNNISEGLHNHDQSVVLSALADLSLQIARGHFPTDAIKLLLNKLLLQSDPAVEAALNYLAAWINEKKNYSSFLPLAEEIVKILKKFYQTPLLDGDLPFIEEMSVRIAFALKEMGITDPFITEWLNYAERSIFNNVRHWYKAAINKIEYFDAD